MATITLFTKAGCPWCDGAREYLESAGVPFTEKEVFSDEALMEEMVQKSGQHKAPVLEVDGEILADTDAEAIEKFLKERGIVAA